MVKENKKTTITRLIKGLKMAKKKNGHDIKQFKPIPKVVVSKFLISNWANLLLVHDDKTNSGFLYQIWYQVGIDIKFNTGTNT